MGVQREPWEDGTGATDVAGFLAAFAEDDNTYWRAGPGHVLNVLDALLDRIADYDRDVAEAEARGWNAAVAEARRSAASTPLHSESSGIWEQQAAVWADIDAAIAALRKPEVEG